MTVTPGGGDARPWWLPPSPPEAPPCPTHTRMPHCTRVQSAQSAHSLLPQGTHARDQGEAPHPASTPRAPAASARRSAPPADAVPRGWRRPGCGVCGAATPLTSLSCDSSPRGHPAVCPFASLPGVCHAEGPRLGGVSCCAALAAPAACLWVLWNLALGARPVRVAGWTARGLAGAWVFGGSAAKRCPTWGSWSAPLPAVPQCQGPHNTSWRIEKPSRTGGVIRRGIPHPRGCCWFSQRLCVFVGVRERAGRPRLKTRGFHV